MMIGLAGGRLLNRGRSRRARLSVAFHGVKGAPGRRWRAVRIGMLPVLLAVVATSTAMFRTGPIRLDRVPGRVVADFALPDVQTGRIHRLSDHRGRVAVVVFVGTTCPVGDLYLPRLIAMSTLYRARGVDFLAINANASEPIADIAAHARAAGVNFPVLKDAENRAADQLLAERTCEALVIDRHGRLRYRGAIDDQYTPGRRRGGPLHEYLAGAIEAILDGRTVDPETTTVAGCPIERTAPRLNVPTPAPSTAATEAAPARAVTYADDVAPILYKRCASCHRPGQVAPFSLLTYEHARRWATSIVEVIDDGRMPPWNADPRYGTFENDPTLTSEEHGLLESWVAQGAPSGDLSHAPRPPQFPQGWTIGTPDRVFEMPEPFAVPAEGTIPIQRIRVATNLKEDLYIQASQIRPGDRAVVHHICVFVDDPNGSEGTGRQNALAAYTPGDRPSMFPPGVGKRIPRGSALIFEVHYTTIGRPRFDRSSLGLVLCTEPPRHLAYTRGIPNHLIRIPAGDPDYIAHAGWKTNRPIQLLGFSPHMHYRGKSFTYAARYPDGRREVLLSVPHYDFNWQTTYRLAEPKPLPAGTRIECEAHFDNSTGNLANPDPARTVTWGEQSWDEMMIGFVDYY